VGSFEMHPSWLRHVCHAPSGSLRRLARAVSALIAGTEIGWEHGVDEASAEYECPSELGRLVEHLTE